MPLGRLQPTVIIISRPYINRQVMKEVRDLKLQLKFSLTTTNSYQRGIFEATDNLTVDLRNPTKQDSVCTFCFSVEIVATQSF